MKTLVLKSRGAVYLEFIIVFLPVFTLFLGSIQMALMYGANLVVRHAATTAARAAIVVLDDDPSKYGDQPRNNVEKQDDSGDSGGGLLSSLQGLLGQGGDSGSDSGQDTDSGSELGGKRFTAIRSAANLPLLGISPPIWDVLGLSSNQQTTLRSSIGGANLTRLAGAYVYNQGAVAVTFPTAPGATSYRTSFGTDDDVTVRVTYLYNCAVPIVNRWMCDSYISLRYGVSVEGAIAVAQTISNGGSWSQIQAAVNSMEAANNRIEAAESGVNELQSGAAMPNLMLGSLGGRFHILRADAQMPNHGARYEFQNGNGE